MARIAALTRGVIRMVPPVRWAVKSRPMQRIIQTQRAARVLRPSGRFILREASHQTIGSYRLRPTGGTLYLRHHTRDIEILNEVFGATGGDVSYRPPPIVGDLLAGRSLRVLDIGANIGLFGLYVLSQWRVSELKSFEPDPDNVSLLRATANENTARQSWQVFAAAVSNRFGKMRFARGLLADGRKAIEGDESIEVPTVDLFSIDHSVDLLKMDIEGGEWTILTEPRLSSLKARVVVMEWHSQFCPDSDPQGLAERLFHAAGFVGHYAKASTATNGLLWVWR